MTLLVKTLGLAAKVEENFDDVTAGAYYYEAVGVAKKYGIAGGAGDNRFNPKTNISRQDMMTLTGKALEKFGGLELTSDLTALDQFSDKNGIAGYARESMAALTREGLITGSGAKLNPSAPTTRAEAAAFLYRIYNETYMPPAS